MASWTDESVLQRPPSEDSGRPRARRHAQGPGGPHLRGRDLHRQALCHQGLKGEPLEPAKAPGKRPKIDERLSKLLEGDLKERPFVTLQQRCDYVEGVMVAWDVDPERLVFLRTRWEYIPP